MSRTDYKKGYYGRLLSWQLMSNRINSKFQVTRLSQPIFNTPVLTGYWRVQTIDSVFRIP